MILSVRKIAALTLCSVLTVSSVCAFTGDDYKDYMGLQVLNQSGMVWKMSYGFKTPSGASYSLSWLDGQQTVQQGQLFEPGASKDFILKYNEAMGSQVSDSGLITFQLASDPQKHCDYIFNLDPGSKNLTLSLDQSISTASNCAAFVKTQRKYMEFVLPGSGM